MSNDEYQQQSYWTTLNKRLNEEQESVCVERDNNGKCLVSLSFAVIDLSAKKDKLFCQSIKDNEDKMA